MLAEEFYRDADPASTGPLAHLRVLDVTKVWSGPLASGVLADLGADVIRIELPYGRDGDVPPQIPGTGRSWFRETVNRNKRSVGLDLREPAGRAAFLELVATADVVVENYRPGTLDGWGVGYRQCREVRPGVVFVSVSGWGQYGPGAHRAAYDPAVQAAAGWMSLNGEPGGPPMRAPTFLADELAGLHAAIGALAAIVHRDRTGDGQHVDVSMMDTLLAGSAGLPTLAAAGAPPRRSGNETDFVVPSNVYACTDGYVYLAVALNKHWRELAAAMGRPELGRASGYGGNAERIAHRADVDALVAGWCAGLSTQDVLDALQPRGLVIAPVRTLAQVVADPDLHERGTLQHVTLTNGTSAVMVAPPARFSRTPTRIRCGAPEPGQHTAEILGEQPYAATGEKTAPSPVRYG
ncbi:CaiB/BaiF CoA transferase family protein [Dactylosporangium sp. CS-033363]|uniref:CaiB/BaiF CoA transferase family protein n=1 Tax=Dactylosporangium sp. CS-033363 TaxID=3239935 RepID=UPI003D8E796F